MARQRRTGFRPPELRGTLGTLLRTAVPAVRDVLERGAREGRARLDDALSGRRRSDALAELGEIVLDLIRRGEIDVTEIPEVADIVHHLDQLDADATPPAAPRSLTRKRFDDRGPPPTERGTKRARATAPAEDDDGTVASRTWSAPSSNKTRAPANAPAAAAKVWRPTAPPTARPDDEVTARERPRGAAPIPGHNPAKKGGISFEDDDLADYMHPDDVPPKDDES